MWSDTNAYRVNLTITAQIRLKWSGAEKRPVQDENLAESLCRLRKVYGKRRYGQSLALILREGPKVCCGLAAQSNWIDQQRDTGEFVCLPNQGGQSSRLVLSWLKAIKRESCLPTGYPSWRIPFSSKCNSLWFIRNTNCKWLDSSLFTIINWLWPYSTARPPQQLATASGRGHRKLKKSRYSFCTWILFRIFFLLLLFFSPPLFSRHPTTSHWFNHSCFRASTPLLTVVCEWL